MRILQVTRGWEADACFPLTSWQTVIGRHEGCTIHLPLPDVSRQHARLTCEDEACFLEDLGSRNGTFINDGPVTGRHRLQHGDRIEVGSVEFIFHDEAHSSTASQETHIAEQSESRPSPPPAAIVAELDVRPDLRYDLNPAVKLNALLKVIGHLGTSLGLEEVLTRILEGVFEIFPQADRGYVLLSQVGSNGQQVGAMKSRHDDSGMTLTFGPLSRTIATRVLTEGKALLTADALHDERFSASGSVLEMEIRSMMCAPLVGHAQQPLGVLQIDGRDPDREFTPDDLDVLVSVAALAAQAVEYSRAHQDLLDALARRRQLEAEMAEVTAREQQRLGQELHDGLGQELIGLRLMAESVHRRLPKESPEAAEIQELANGLRRALEQARALARGLVPEEVPSDDLPQALQRLAQRTESRMGLACCYEGPLELMLRDDRTAMSLFRIAQEAVTNACKHARATQIRIELRTHEGIVQLIVSDNGVGLPKQLPEGAGVGQRIMRFRANVIGAKLQIGAARGGGTSVACLLSE